MTDSFVRSINVATAIRDHRWPTARLILALIIVALSTACVGGQRAETLEGAALPNECEAFVADYGHCLSKGGSGVAAMSVGRTEQTRLALIAEAERGPDALPALRAKCSQARERLTTTCR